TEIGRRVTSVCSLPCPSGAVSSKRSGRVGPRRGCKRQKPGDLPGLLCQKGIGWLAAPVRFDVVVALVGVLGLFGDAASVGLDLLVAVVFELLRRLLEPLFIRHDSLLLGRVALTQCLLDDR